jgi:hypothetical protein
MAKIGNRRLPPGPAAGLSLYEEVSLRQHRTHMNQSEQIAHNRAGRSPDPDPPREILDGFGAQPPECPIPVPARLAECGLEYRELHSVPCYLSSARSVAITGCSITSML